MSRDAAVGTKLYLAYAGLRRYGLKWYHMYPVLGDDKTTVPPINDVEWNDPYSFDKPLRTSTRAIGAVYEVTVTEKGVSWSRGMQPVGWVPGDICKAWTLANATNQQILNAQAKIEKEGKGHSLRDQMFELRMQYQKCRTDSARLQFLALVVKELTS